MPCRDWYSGSEVEGVVEGVDGKRRGRLVGIGMDENRSSEKSLCNNFICMNC